MWSSTNGRSLLAIVEHVFDTTYTHRTALLALPRIWESYSRENMAAALLTVVESYDIAKNLGCFIMDNAASNDTLVVAVDATPENVTEKSRLHCAGHLINLVVKAILYEEEISDFEREIIGCSDATSFEPWRRFGPVSKVHNTVKFIMRSDQRR